MIRLTLKQEDGRTSVQEFAKEDVLLGRSEEADVRLESDSVSRRHARLLKKADGWKVTDLGAANGVFVQRGGLPPAQRVIVEDITSGDVLCIEKFRILFEQVDGDALRAAPSGATDLRADLVPENFTRVTTLPKFIRPDLGDLGSQGAADPTSGAHLNALLALSGPPASRLSRTGTPPQSRKPVLDIIEPNAAQARRLVLGAVPVSFGSDPQCEVRIQGMTVPRYLATVELAGDKALLRRLSSGIMGPRVTVEGKPVKDAELESGQSAQVGPVRITFLKG